MNKMVIYEIGQPIPEPPLKDGTCAMCNVKLVPALTTPTAKPDSEGYYAPDPNGLCPKCNDLWVLCRCGAPHYVGKIVEVRI